ncbi:hypothetical protein [Saccharicrinis fermentans]|uniref:Lipoprotein n=1 Tax=Saccharicrinis fermentans DSM 9555 = JCM 21142 TaxID=869213 RepID=W7YAY0_9BACT|nr:hypothetical protein [Saccharicrinis fermentans]GAF05552.1 hypothetical protein JCM21142_104292 [Saccharicrinis fermentans DSM 9555 = JCM 21142]
MTKIISFTILFVFIIGCSKPDESYLILNDVLCDVIGEGYKYESYISFCERIDSLPVEQDFYLEHRVELPTNEKVVFFDAELTTDIKDREFFNVNSIKLNDLELNTFEGFIKSLGVNTKLDTNQLISNCGYQYGLISDDIIKEIKPSKRIVFFISHIYISNDNKNACFFIEGGQGPDYWDALVFANKNERKWYVSRKIYITDY